ncbi:MAG: type II secretion system F family protein [Candidatus Omnitrophica bacterium]|nr:type II secretion system F family protein [Candidatus Omnitrophota bacterium]
MPTFSYTAKRGPNDTVEGIMDAENRGGVLSRLAELGYTPVRIIEQVPAAAAEPSRPSAAAHAPAGRIRVGPAHLVTFTRQFASLVRSQVPMLRTLHILQEQARQPAFRQVLRELTETVRQGQTLSDGLAKFPSVFPPIYVSLVHAGEVSGALDAVLERLAAELEHDQELQTKVRTALTYPAFVGVVGCGTIVFFLTFVLPRLTQQLTGFGQRLPGATRALLAVTAGISSPWFWTAWVVVGAALVLIWRGASERQRLALDRWLLRLPLAGALLEQLEVARFARSFGLMIMHGIPILRAVDVAIPVARHRAIREQLGRVPEGLRQGKALSACLQELAIGSPFFVNTVAVGEESGKVGDALAEVAAYYERDAARLLQTFATLLEPALIVAVGAVVGFIVIAVLLPIFEMSSIVQ